MTGITTGIGLVSGIPIEDTVDQLMAIGWKVMLPLALLNLFLTGALVSLGVF